MAKHLTRAHVAAIVNIIYGWETSLITWEGICDAVVSVVGKRPTRQSLNGHKEIVAAYTSKKAAIRTFEPVMAKPSSLSAAASRIRNLESKIADLQMQNSVLLEYLTLLQYNAYKRGMTEGELTIPLPKIDRERTSESLDYK
ncbi:hypothetical protein ACIOWK_34355 [Pseudomonas protegens]|uniref:hypothetical protein n=1 Tax=Pseudomonas protegens TaxID=380021 RepID=UPI00380C7B81